ncbi:P-loop containing nucleoside triphosphate hydrolase protein [Coniophora puteana RWD-64-598 SS2]|uniref:P-loop containing nucleoside triphosphate hydrolase protein n=1 Tax=Coniophora puteana (strain RWD-64-598) TaxID=741705 RepID=A0A5M3M899_CONPW|nr:P-loop containing nucleoside triphosphate hydrolase protein [Coniophora puteana RWD-64-598 SS2]EIW75156.1 P-loop containing nucleoside triphosphate hydrolase protein [Coniophora puteana RWD-64-598 SS2]
MDMLKGTLSTFGMGGANAIQDTLKLVVIGGTVETARRASVSAWNSFVDSFFLTAHFSQDDYPYDWLMHWLSKQPAWGRSREFEITTRSVGRSGMTQSTSGDVEEEEEELVDDDDEALIQGRKKRRITFMPHLDTTHTIYYRGHWLRITRSKRYPDYGHGAMLKISVVARSNDILKQLVLEAKREYEKDAEHRVHIFMADTNFGCWRWNGARQKRPMSSIVLQPGVKDMLLADCKDFLRSEDWYAERGIPFRRGYLLHGVPGSGKTSLIHSLAGELGLDIYVVSLSSKGMSDNTLATLMGNVPSRCILLLEDLDAAFTRSVSRDSSSTGAPNPVNPFGLSGSSNNNDTNDGSTLSLSGLLNSLDGVAAAEGRLLFATTNHLERLDPALSRPGRMDVWVNFTHATKWQAEGIFKCFFQSQPLPKGSEAPKDKGKEREREKEPDVSQKNMPGSGPERKSGLLVPVLEEEDIAALAKGFADAIPENELSVAALQGYLLKNKLRPRECVDEVAEWVVQEREMREKLKREKAEREAQERKEAEERERKEREERLAKELEEKELKQKLERKESRSKAKKASRAPPPDSAKQESSSQLPAAITPSSDSSASSSESENSTGIEADTEESITSEEESDKVKSGESNSSKSAGGKEPWVSIKGQPTPVVPPAPAPNASPASSDPC